MLILGLVQFNPGVVQEATRVRAKTAATFRIHQICKRDERGRRAFRHRAYMATLFEVTLKWQRAVATHTNAPRVHQVV